MKKIFAVILVLLMSSTWTSLSAQSRKVQIKRTEIENEKDVDIQRCDPIGKGGMLLTLKSDEKQKRLENNKEIITFCKYDTALKMVKTADVLCAEQRIRPENDYFTDGSNLFRACMFRRGDYELLYLDGETLTPTFFQGDIDRRSDVKARRAAGGYAYIMGIADKLPYVLCINVKTGEKNVIEVPVEDKRSSVYVSFETADNVEESYLFLKERVNKEYVLKFYVISKNKIVQNYTITSEGDGKIPSTVYACKTDDGSYIISGTYSIEGSKAKNASTKIASGVFVKKIKNGATVFSNYTNFHDIRNYLECFSDRYQKRVEKGKEKKAKKGEELNVNYLMLPHKIIIDNDKYILLGESYYEKTHMEARTEIGMDGKAKTTWHRVFDGYAFTHFFIIEYDQHGNVIWSNAAPFSAPLSKKLSRHISISKEANSIDLVYPEYGKMNYITFGLDGELTKRDEMPYVDEGERLKTAELLDTDYWYENNFLITGLLKIKSDDGKRRVFSVNKLTFKK